MTYSRRIRIEGQTQTAETDTTKRLAPDGVGGVEFVTGGSGAPDDATYLVATSHSGLSAEIPVGTTPGGELGGTWASPTVDATHSGSTHSAATDAHIADTTDAHDASAVSVDTTGFGNSSATELQTLAEDFDAAITAAGGGGLPPGYEFDYVEKTSNTSITATTEATADTVVTGNAVAFDGSTVVIIEVFSPAVYPSATTGRNITLWLYDGSGSIGAFSQPFALTNANNPQTIVARRRLTPSAATHTYSLRASVSAGTGTVAGGAGGTGAFLPAYIRITKV